MVNTLFVYGTLCPGRENEAILSVIGGHFKKATVRGVHYPDGWLDDFPYPGIELDESGEVIQGYIFSSPDLFTHWGRLDAFEGPNYERVLTNVQIAGTVAVEAYVYVIRRMAY